MGGQRVIAAAINPCPDCGEVSSEDYGGLGLCWTCFERRGAGKGTARKLTAVSDTDPVADEDIAGRLERLLALDKLRVPLTITGAQVIGDGAEAAAFVALSDGSELRFRSLREMCQPGKLAAEVVATTGAVPKLNQQLAMLTVSLLKRYAQHVRTMSEADEAVDWAVGFLQAAEVLDVDIEDQGERWGAFNRLAEIDPRKTHRETNVSIAASSLVLRCVDGSRLVRTDWMRSHVRSIEPRVTPAQLVVLLQRIGWVRRGKKGRWKATRPGLPGQLNWSFWLVPPGWEDRGEEAQGGAVTPGVLSPPAIARPPAPARVGSVTSRNQGGKEAGT